MAAELNVRVNRQIVWKNVAVYLIGHAIAMYGMYLVFFVKPLIQSLICITIGYVVNLHGISLGAHRYYSHRSFKASKTMRWIMVLFQAASSQNSMYVWVRDHRQHHKFSDTDADPHNSKNGFFFAHVGWLLSKKHPDVIKMGKGVDMSDLDADPIVQFQKKHYKILWWTFAMVIPTAFITTVLGEPIWTAVLLNIAIIILRLNVTFLVNSWAHLYGNRPFDKNIQPVDSALVNFLTGGEGHHNYHHTFPWDYKASGSDARRDLATALIHFYARLGMIWDLKEASQETISARAFRTGDGTPLLTKSKMKNHD